MKNLKRYLEEKTDSGLSDGIRSIESALSSLYSLDKSLSTNGNEESLDRKVQHIIQRLSKAAAYFGLQEYEGTPIPGTPKENVTMAVGSLSKILTAYNDGIDDPISWGKNCMDIIATLSDSRK